MLPPDLCRRERRRTGAESFLPHAVPGGGAGGEVACRPCHSGTRGGACLSPRPPTLPSPFFLPPYPPTPLPRWGRGRILLYFAGGFAPGTPALNPPAALTDLATQASRWRVRLLPRPPALPLALFSAPIPPAPFPAGRGRILLYFAGGFAPGTPALNRLRHLQSCQTGTRRKGKPAACCKSDRRAFLWAVSAAKERGDRGRGTSAFEMVLSPGAGRASAAGGTPPGGDSGGRVSRCRFRFSPGDARGEAPCIRKLKVSPFPAGRALCERGSGGWGQKTKLKAWQAGDKAGTPSLRTPQRQEQPVPLGVQPPSPPIPPVPQMEILKKSYNL